MPRNSKKENPNIEKYNRFLYGSFIIIVLLVSLSNFVFRWLLSLSKKTVICNLPGILWTQWTSKHQSSLKPFPFVSFAHYPTFAICHASFSVYAPDFQPARNECNCLSSPFLAVLGRNYLLQFSGGLLWIELQSLLDDCMLVERVRELEDYPG